MAEAGLALSVEDWPIDEVLLGAEAALAVQAVGESALLGEQAVETPTQCSSDND